MDDDDADFFSDFKEGRARIKFKAGSDDHQDSDGDQNSGDEIEEGMDEDSEEVEEDLVDDESMVDLDGLGGDSEDNSEDGDEDFEMNKKFGAAPGELRSCFVPSSKEFPENCSLTKRRHFRHFQK